MINRLIAFAILAIIQIDSAEAQGTPTDITSACLSALENNQTDDIQENIIRVQNLRNIFNSTARRQGAECLTRATGEVWEYSTIEGKFISGEALLSENQRVNSAPDRRAALEASRIRELQETQQALEIIELRRQEAIRLTLAMCTLLYEEDRASALMNPVCNPIFLEFGVPDSVHPLPN